MKLSELSCIENNINLDDYIKYKDETKSHMKYPEWLGDFTKDNLVSAINNKAKIWMYYLNDEFVCSMMILPSSKDSLNKFELDYNYKYVIDYGPMFANFKYIGNNLQYQMLLELDKYSKNNGYKYAVSTIHPDNIYSIRNIVKDNFKCSGTKEFKRGLRNIYIKNL